MTALRFCLATTFYPPFSFGGDGVAVQQLARALVRRGHEVTVVHDVDAFAALHPDPVSRGPDEETDEAGVRVIHLRSGLGAVSSLLVQQAGRPVLQARTLRKLLADSRWDVVHFHNVSLLGGPGILAYPAGAVTLYTAHEHWLVCPTHVLWRDNRERCESKACLKCVVMHHRPPQLWRYGNAIEEGLSHVDVVIALSDFSRHRHQAFGLARQMEVLPGFLSAEFDTAPVSWPRPYFFFAGRLETPKGLDDVLAVFRNFRSADLIIAGDGSPRARWQAVAADLPHVHFLGQLSQAQVRGYQRDAVAALVPSVGYETFGLALIEAMGQGTPVIARRLGPFPELIAQGGGELFSTGEELNAALHRLSSDPAHRARLAARALAAAGSVWSEAAVMKGYFELVRGAAARRRHTRLLASLPARAA